MGEVQQEQRGGVPRLVVRSKSNCDVCSLSSWEIGHQAVEVRREQPHQQRRLRHVRPLEQDQQGLHRQVGFLLSCDPTIHTKSRISECQDAHRNLKSNLILTKNVSSFHIFLEAHPHLGHLGCWTINKDIVENSKTCHTEDLTSIVGATFACSGHLYCTYSINITSELKAIVQNVSTRRPIVLYITSRHML